MAVPIILNNDAQSINFVRNPNDHKFDDSFQRQVKQHSQNIETPKRNPQPGPRTNFEQKFAVKERALPSQNAKQPEADEPSQAQISSDEQAGTNKEGEGVAAEGVSIGVAKNTLNLSDIIPSDTAEIIEPESEPLFQETEISSDTTNEPPSSKTESPSHVGANINKAQVPKTESEQVALPLLKEEAQINDTEDQDEVAETENNSEPAVLATILPAEVKTLQAPADKQFATEGNESEGTIQVEFNAKNTSQSRNLTSPDTFVAKDFSLPASDEAAKDTLEVKTEAALLPSQGPEHDAPKLDQTLAGPASASVTQGANDRPVRNQPAKDSIQKTAPENVQVESVTVTSLNAPDDTGAGGEGSAGFGSQPKSTLISASDIQKPQEAFEITEPETPAVISSLERAEAPAHIIVENKEEVAFVANQIKTAVQNINNINGKKITVNLTPETLGRVEIEITVQAGKISAIKIEAAKAETVAMLEKHSGLLQDALKEVTGGNEASLSFNLQEGNHGKNEQQAPAKNTQFFADLAEFEGSRVSPSAERAPSPKNIYDVNGTNTNVDMRL